MKTKKQELGSWGEEQAVHFLQNKGYQILERNYRIRKGEIDIIALCMLQGEKTLAFIEVKTRNCLEDGSAERATGKQKLHSIFRAAEEYCLLQHIAIDKMPIQFEQVSIYGNSQENCDLKHYVIPIN